MSRPRSSFRRVIELIRVLEEDLEDLEQRLAGPDYLIPQELYRPSNELIRYCRTRVESADRFRRDHREYASVWFFDFIALWSGSLGVDHLARHERKLEKCKKAVTLAIETTKAMSIANERGRIFNITKHGSVDSVDSAEEAAVLQRDIELDRIQQACRERLAIALDRTLRPRLRMRGARVGALRRFARGLLHPNNSRSTITISSRSNLDRLQNWGYRSRPQMHYPYAAPEHDHGRPVYYPHRPHPPARAHSPSQSASRGGRSISTDHGRRLPTGSNHGMATGERQSHRSQRARHNPAPTNAINEPRQSRGTRSRRRSRGRGFDGRGTEYRSPARENPSESRRESSRRHTTCAEEPSEHRRRQGNHRVGQQPSRSHHRRQTERTSRSKAFRPRDEQSTRERRTSRRQTSSRHHQDDQQTRRGRRSSRRRRSSSNWRWRCW